MGRIDGVINASAWGCVRESGGRLAGHAKIPSKRCENAAELPNPTSTQPKIERVCLRSVKLRDHLPHPLLSAMVVIILGSRGGKVTGHTSYRKGRQCTPVRNWSGMAANVLTLWLSGGYCQQYKTDRATQLNILADTSLSFAMGRRVFQIRHKYICWHTD